MKLIYIILFLLLPLSYAMSTNDQTKDNQQLSNLGQRIIKSNNRTLCTLVGCLGGLITGSLLVAADMGSMPLIGNPSELPLAYKLVGILLATGTGGNLLSYIGASIDVITNENTIFYFCCNK
jgi:hypothetical protein